jgi:hypothetical protein
MSELTLFEGKKLPAHISDAADEDTKALAGKSVGMRRISIKGGVFREMLGGKELRASEERAMNVAIVRVAPHNSRQFFPGTYVEGEKVAPVCWSADGQKPDTGVKEKQATNCSMCPQNVKGSGQGESRACRFQRRVAVMIENEIERREVYQLICPATSVFGDGERGKLPLQKYAQHLQAHRTPITKIITEIRFDTASTQPKLTFKAIRPLTDDEYDIVVAMRDSPEATAAVSLNVAQTDGIDFPSTLFLTNDEPAEEVVKAPKPVAKKVAAPEPEVEADVEEPKKAPSKKATVELKVADLVGEWDD